MLPSCQALSAKNRTPCKNKVSMQGENFCSHHGGRQRGFRQVLVQDPSLSVSNEGGANEGRANDGGRIVLVPGTPQQAFRHGGDVNWSEVQNACLDYILNVHPASGCPCTAQDPCQSFALVLWAQKASKITQSSPGKSLFGVPVAQLNTLLPEQNHDLFQDVLAAVKLFGGGNVSFVPQLFQHIQQSFPKDVDDVNNNNNSLTNNNNNANKNNTNNNNAARNLFRDGKELMDEGDDVL